MCGIAGWYRRSAAVDRGGILERGEQGFQMPLSSWFAGDFGSFAQALWRDGGAADAGYLTPRAVDRLFDEHREGRSDHSRFLYAMSVFAPRWSARP